MVCFMASFACNITEPMDVVKHTILVQPATLNTRPTRTISVGRPSAIIATVKWTLPLTNTTKYPYGLITDVPQFAKDPLRVIKCPI